MRNLKILILFWISCLAGYAIGDTVSGLLSDPKQSWIDATTPIWWTAILAVLVFVLYKAIEHLQMERASKYAAKMYKPDELVGLNYVEDMRK